jgi:AAT family amino acid transporter
MSADNHALFGASRLLFARVVDGNAPRFVGKLNCLHVPWVAVLAASTSNGLCFGASYMSEGQLWSWLQNIVNKSKQISWISTGLASSRFRAGIKALNFEHLLPMQELDIVLRSENGCEPQYRLAILTRLALFQFEFRRR